MHIHHLPSLRIVSFTATVFTNLALGKLRLPSPNVSTRSRRRSLLKFIIIVFLQYVGALLLVVDDCYPALLMKPAGQTRRCSLRVLLAVGDDVAMAAVVVRGATEIAGLDIVGPVWRT